jgi:hypothetical protein
MNPKKALFLTVFSLFLNLQSTEMKNEAESYEILSYYEQSLIKETLELENSRGVTQKEILLKTLMQVVDKAHAIFIETNEKSQKEDGKKVDNSSPFEYNSNTLYSKFKQLCEETEHIFFKKTIVQWANDIGLQEISDKLCFCNVFCQPEEGEIIIDWEYIWKTLFQFQTLDQIKSAYEKFEFNVDESYTAEKNCLFCKNSKKTFKEMVSTKIIWKYLTKSEMILLHSFLFNLNSIINKIVKIKDFAAEINKIKKLCQRHNHHYYSHVIDIWHSIKKLEDKQYDERENYCLCTLLTSREANLVKFNTTTKKENVKNLSKIEESKIIVANSYNNLICQPFSASRAT